MAANTYRSTTKTIIGATPTVRISDSKVTNWDVSAIYTDANTGWNTTYTATVDVSSANQYANQFSLANLVSYFSSNSAYDIRFDSEFNIAHTAANNITIQPSYFDLKTLKANT